MARSVETVTTNAVFFRPFVRNAVVTVARRNIFVKSVSNAAMEFQEVLVSAYASRPDVRRIMRRQSGVEFFHCGNGVVRYQLNSGITFRKDSLKTNTSNFIRAFKQPVSDRSADEGIRERQHMIKGRYVFFFLNSPIVI